MANVFAGDLSRIEQVMLSGGLLILIALVFYHALMAEQSWRTKHYDLRELHRVRQARDTCRRLVDNLTEIADTEMTTDERHDVMVALEEAKLALQRHSQRYAVLMRGGART